MGEITEALRRAEREREGRLVRTGARAPEARWGRGEGRVRRALAGTTDCRTADADQDCGVASAASLDARGPLAPVIPLRPAPEPRRGLAKFAARVQIPRTRKGFWQPRLLALEQPGPLAEHYRHFAVRLGRELQQRQTNTVLITSPGPGEGKTTTAFNLALAFATLSAGQRVALVDLDLRQPSIGRALELQVAGGLEAVLAGRADLVSACARSDFPSLDVFLTGTARANGHELLVGERLPAILRELAAAYHTVVLDSPPVLPVPDAALIAAHAGICVPVVRAGHTRRASLGAAFELLPKDRIAGLFLAETRSKGVTPSSP